jgi:ABC-type Na+ transport system ATPase subunit NatA
MDKTPPPILVVDNVSKSFDGVRAVNGCSLTVREGAITGLIGPNGAGKTTFIRHLLGAYEAEAGTVRVFGLDPVRNPVAVLGRIGYLSEDRDLPLWMKVRELMAYTAAFYPDWDAAYGEELRKRFNLSPDAKLKQLSRGEKAKAGLLAALAHRPDLLLLDEPSSGLDAVARKDILGEVEHGYYLVGHRIPSIAESRENFRISARKVYEIRNGELGRLYRDGGIMADTRDYLMNVDAVGTDFRLYPIPNCGKGQPMQTKRLGNGGPTMRSRARLTGGA